MQILQCGEENAQKVDTELAIPDRVTTDGDTNCLNGTDSSLGNGDTQSESEGEERAARKTRRNPYHPSAEDLAIELDSLSRGAFKRTLADFLLCSPTPEAIQKLAERSPDRWAQSLTMLASLAGFKKDTMEVNNLFLVGSLSDADLMKRLRQVEGANGENKRLIEVQQVQPAFPNLNPSTDESIIDVKMTEVQENNDNKNGEEK